MTHLFKGAGVALITPFKEDYSIDFNALEELVEDQISSGMDYLVALGTTAETPTLSAGEQKEVVQCIKSKANKRVPVMLGMGGNDPYKIIKNIEDTDFEGIAGILSVTPYYNRPSQPGLIEHYKLVAKASPVPVVLYNVPSRTGVNMEAATSVAVANACPNVIAVKEASGESSQVARMVKHGPEQFAVISGDDVLALPVIAVGGIGVISVIANALPEKLSRLVHFANNGQFAESRELHLQLVDLLKLIFREGNPVGVKALMEIMGKSTGVVRLPLYPASRELRNDLEEELKRVLS
ncbi:4-hydroxy-tetrahydrodipicolinate synthase [Gaoshiqia sp. Z1-71]|uniref:4-hydroxy-tetrahydrodipicolinate synthase n=1 Tax=Gaoshiqia hydrogeniformans TaxID=3290090 RepID=UPI003BF857A5